MKKTNKTDGVLDYKHIISENKKRSIIEYGLCGDNVIEIYLKKYRIVVRIMDDDKRPNGYFIAVEPYQCKKCEDEWK